MTVAIIELATLAASIVLYRTRGRGVKSLHSMRSPHAVRG